jgi:hypothetical protein
MVSGPIAGIAATAASSPLGGIGSFFQNIFRPNMSSSSSSLGTLWQSHAAAKAFQTQDLKSVPDAKYAKPLRVTFRNCGPDPLLLCWIDDKGAPHHFKTLNPTGVGRSHYGRRSHGMHVDRSRLLVGALYHTRTLPRGRHEQVSGEGLHHGRLSTDTGDK